MPKYVELPVSKLIIDLELIAFVGQVDLNKYNIFLRIPTQAYPLIDGKDRDALLAALGAERLKELPILA